MRIVLLGILFLSLIQMNCISNKSTQSVSVKENSQHNIPTAPTSDYSPGTCGLEFQVESIVKHGEYLKVTAKTINVIGRGAGLTRSFTPGESIHFSVLQSANVKFTFYNSMRAVFLLEETMGTSQATLKYLKPIE